MTSDQRFLRAAALTLALAVSAPAAAADALDQAVNAPHRSTEHRARDAWRHPAETLRFFGIRPTMNVVEIWPGKSGWYTEILAPYLVDEGQLTVAVFGDQTDQYRDFMLKANEEFAAKLDANPAVYEAVAVTSLWAPAQTGLAPPGSQDMILTFRNLHNWMRWGQTEDVLAACFEALKPGGILGVTDHRSPEGREIDPEARNGYVDQARAIRLIQAAGFEFVASSEINANPKDTADHPSGVWTLPPTLTLGEEDRKKYLAIGESDRFTLKFIKPGN